MERLRCGDGQKSKAGGESGGQTWLTGTNGDSQSKSVGSDGTERDRLVTNDVSVGIWWKREAATQDWRDRDVGGDGRGLPVTSVVQVTLCKHGRDCLSQSQRS